MSSKQYPIYKDRPYKRGEQKNDELFPDKIKEILNKIISICGEVGIFGSYKSGMWVDDSDLDVGIKDHKKYKETINKISNEYSIKIDLVEIRDWMLKIK